MKHWTHEQRIKHRAEIIGLDVRMRESGEMQFASEGQVLTNWMQAQQSIDWLSEREAEWAERRLAARSPQE